MEKLNLTGQRFGRLLAVKEIDSTIQKNSKPVRRYLCVCDCGAEIPVDVKKLRNGHTQSCGCLRNEKASARRKKHGASSGKTLKDGKWGKGTREYRAWQAAKSRCFNSNTIGYKNYGGCGVTMCDRWKNSFENFLADMGVCPDGFSIDRVDPNGNYEPNNCRWASRTEQARNYRNSTYFEYEGQKFTIAGLADYAGVKASKLHYYHKVRNLPLDVAVEKAMATTKNERTGQL